MNKGDTDHELEVVSYRKRGNGRKHKAKKSLRQTDNISYPVNIASNYEDNRKMKFNFPQRNQINNSNENIKNNEISSRLTGNAPTIGGEEEVKPRGSICYQLDKNPFQRYLYSNFILFILDS